MENRFIKIPRSTVALRRQTIEEMLGAVFKDVKENERGHTISHALPVSKSHYEAAIRAARGAALATLTYAAGLTDLKHMEEVVLQPHELEIVYVNHRKEEKNGPRQEENVWITLRNVHAVDEAMRVLNHCPGRLEIKYEGIFRAVNIRCGRGRTYSTTGVPDGKAGWGTETARRMEEFMESLDPYLSQHAPGA